MTTALRVTACVLTALTAAVMTDLPSAQALDRDTIIARKLNCVAQNLNNSSVSWENVCYTTDSTTKSIDVTMDESGDVRVTEPETMDTMDMADPVPMQDTSRHNLADFEQRTTTRTNSLSNSILSRDNPLNGLEIAPEYFYYQYEEPGLMKQDGMMYGIYAAYTYRTGENRHIKSMRDIFNAQNGVNVFRVESHFDYGKLDYTSNGTGSDSNIPNYIFSIQGTLGYDIPWSETLRITPYAGVGYRYLLDDGGGRVTDTGYWGYDREANYAYIPVGLDSRIDMNHDWSLGMKLEYDFFIDGTQKSHLEDGGVGYDTLTNDQNSGYGVQGSLKLQKATEALDFFVEPFFRYWKIEDSDVSYITSGGAIVVSPDGYVYGGLEPKNETWEYGLRIGVNY